MTQASPQHVARIGLGSNIGDAVAHLENAMGELGRIGVVLARSSLYRSSAWGVTDQADFINAAVLLGTECDPHELLRELKDIERRLGRTQTYRWGPRVIDLDILAFDDIVLDDPDLTIPHARLFERAFALAPLAEIEPTYAGALLELPEAERNALQRIPVEAARTSRAVNWDETLERVRSAAAFCADAGLARVRIDEDGFGIDVRYTPRVASPVAGVPEADLGIARRAASGGNGAVDHDDRPHTILRAEFVGIVRLSRPSVAPGAVLAADRELAYVESLGIRNPIRSGGPGTVADIFVADGEAVEYGQPLFAIEK